MKYIRFQTTFNDRLEGCKNPRNKHLLGYIEIPAPENLENMDGYELTTYVEKTTNLFVLEGFDIIDKIEN